MEGWHSAGTCKYLNDPSQQYLWAKLHTVPTLYWLLAPMAFLCSAEIGGFEELGFEETGFFGLSRSICGDNLVRYKICSHLSLTFGLFLFSMVGTAMARLLKASLSANSAASILTLLRFCNNGFYRSEEIQQSIFVHRGRLGLRHI